MKNSGWKNIVALCQALDLGIGAIDEERKRDLLEIAQQMSHQSIASGELDVIFICTHNSRRSQLGQVLFELALDWYGIDGVSVYSGGTEATAVYPECIAALNRVGFSFSISKDGSNPVYITKLGERLLVLFSKVYDDSFNPEEGFVAILVCSEADEACPTVMGASARHALPFTDPKRFDGSEQETIGYDNKLREIGAECFYLASQMRLLSEEDDLNHH